MRWQKWARGVVAIGGVGCAVAVYMLYGQRKEPPRNAPPPIIEPTTVSQAPSGDFRRTKDGRDTLLIRYASRTTYADGRMKFERAEMKSFGERPLEIWADVVESKGKGGKTDNPAQLNLTGNVRLKTKDGLEAQMDSATYDDASGMLVTPGHLTFTKQRMSGEGDGATYDERQDVLSIVDRAQVKVAADPHGKGALEAVSRQLTLLRPAHVVRLEREARIVRDADTLSADIAVLHMTDDESRLTKIELRERAHVEPGPGKGAASHDMRADDIDLTLYDDGQTIRNAALRSRNGVAVVEMADEGGRRVIEGVTVSLDLARDGQTLTRLDADQRVTAALPKTGTASGARKIESDVLRATGTDPGGLKAATFEGRLVIFTEELPPGTGSGVRARTLTSKRLQLTLGGQLDAIERAEFDGGVDLKDRDGNAGAPRAEHAPDKKRMYLLPARDGSGRSWAGHGDRQVIAREIDLHLDSSDLEARGNVQTSATISPASGRASSPLFEAGAPIIGTSAELRFVGSEATYTGDQGTPAQLRQDLRRVTGDVIVFNRDTSDLRATRHVTAVMLAEKRDAKSKPAADTQYNVDDASSLVYDDESRNALFKGDRVRVRNPDGETTARSFAATFSKDSGAVQQLTWEGDVRAEMAGRRQGVGNRLKYDAATDRYELAGSPAQVLSPSDDGRGCDLADGGVLTFERTSGAVQGTFGIKSLPCNTKLPYKKEPKPMAILRTEGLTKSYGGRTVVRDVNLNVSSGEIVGLLGPNGAGKTTTFSMVVGLTGADAGQVLLDDERVTSDPMYVRARKGIGYLPQEPSVFRGLTVEKNVLAILETQPISAAERGRRLTDLLAELNLTPLARAKAHTLSGGERRRVEITRALVNQPKFMLLDEPFAGIDPIAVGDIQKIIFHLRDRGIGVLITDHNVRETLKITDRAYIVHDGVIFRSGTPESLAADEDVKRIYLGADFRLD